MERPKILSFGVHPCWTAKLRMKKSANNEGHLYLEKWSMNSLRWVTLNQGRTQKFWEGGAWEKTTLLKALIFLKKYDKAQHSVFK